VISKPPGFNEIHAAADNRWNLVVYRLWAPVYDATVSHLFTPGRRHDYT